VVPRLLGAAVIDIAPPLTRTERIAIAILAAAICIIGLAIHAIENHYATRAQAQWHQERSPK